MDATARQLGIRITSGKKTLATVGDGSKIPVYVHRLTVQLGLYRFKANIGFSSRLGVGFNLLGRRDFFFLFDVSFSDSKREITFQPIVSKGRKGDRSPLTIVRTK